LSEANASVDLRTVKLPGILALSYHVHPDPRAVDGGKGRNERRERLKTTSLRINRRHAQVSAISRLAPSAFEEAFITSEPCERQVI
jgi:hypothetical protein